MRAQCIDMASAPTGLSSPGTAEPLRTMHVTRPKSAKGRSRSTPQVSAHNMEAYACRASPTPRVSSARPPSAPRIAQDDVPEGLHQLPYRPPSSSLNRYRVLPSIGAAGGGHDAEDELVHRTSTMRMAAEVRDHRHHHKTLYREPPQHRGGETVSMEDSAVKVPEPPSEEEPRLLLAIRSHSGQRFERYFRPSDTLYAILAAAEEKTGTSCKDCSVEAMEVPRRSFTDHSRTLQECGIPNKSVLCIQRLGRD
ncbi:UBX domain-containing protein 10 isoform X2 [Hyla sarda]|uniref:UBX domain-containing protein 10 isoform X2 n=1 Tax=Hyla sarda TaxID=327740 RepID=UPI0024C32A00|nr:UBX domain-containing protein 10 isoform X2 [Hyla sarda]